LLAKLIIPDRSLCEAHLTLQAVEGRAQDLALLAGILDALEREPFVSDWIVSLKTRLKSKERSPASRVRHLARLLHGLDLKWHVFLVPMPGLFLWTTHFAFAIDRWSRAHGPSLGEWIEIAGEFEAIIAVATYAYENPADPFSSIVEQGACLNAQGLGHPLIDIGTCVRNDLDLGGELRLLIVSGSNMSGKSTLLRAAGLNVVLAQAGAPVRALQLSLSPLALGATLRILDSVQSGTRGPSRRSSACGKLLSLPAVRCPCCSCSMRFCTAPIRTTAASAPKQSCAVFWIWAPSGSSRLTTCP
jgi:hypothetical protein